MTIHLTLSDSRWEHLLVARQDDLHRFYVFLADSKGNRVKKSPVRGGFQSLELITRNAQGIYAALIEMKQRAAEVRMQTGLAAAEAGFQLHAGDPRFDESHPHF